MEIEINSGEIMSVWNIFFLSCEYDLNDRVKINKYNSIEFYWQPDA